MRSLRPQIQDLRAELERHLAERRVGWDRTTVALIIDAFHGDTESFVRHYVRMLGKLDLTLAKNALDRKDD